MTESLRSRTIRLAHENPEMRKDLLPLLSKTAGRNGFATIQFIPSGFKLYWKTIYSPHGLSAEDMPKTGEYVRDRMRRFLGDMKQASGRDDLSIAKESKYVLLDVEGSSIAFKVEATVKAKDFTQQDLDAAKPLLDRFGFTVEVF